MKNDLIELSESKKVKKSERLVMSRYQLNPIALKLVSVLIASLKSSDEIDKEYKFRVKDFAELTGFSSKRIYELIDEATEELLSKPIKIPIENGKGFRKFNWVSKAEYRYGEGLVVFRVDQDLRPFLMEAKEKYLSYPLKNIMRLKSTYHIRFYEILKDFYNTLNRYSKNVEKRISIDWIRDTMGIPDSYRYNDIKRIIVKTQKELEEYTDIKFLFQEEKEGRKVVALNVTIFKNEQK